MHPLQLLVKRGWRGVGKKAYLGPASEGSNKFTQKRPGQGGGGKKCWVPACPRWVIPPSRACSHFVLSHLIPTPPADPSISIISYVSRVLTSFLRVEHLGEVRRKQQRSHK